MPKFDPHRNKGSHPRRHYEVSLPPDYVMPDHEEPVRASQNAICETCGEEYRKHPYNLDILDRDGFPFLHVRCDGVLLKL